MGSILSWIIYETVRVSFNWAVQRSNNTARKGLSMSSIEKNELFTLDVDIVFDRPYIQALSSSFRYSYAKI